MGVVDIDLTARLAAHGPRGIDSVRAMRRPLRGLLLLATTTALVAGCSSSSTTSTTKPAGGGSKETFCGLLIAFRASNDNLDKDVNSGDEATAKAAVERLVAQAKSLEQQAPTGIVADVTVAATFLEQFDQLMAKYSYDLSKLQADSAGVEAYTALSTDAVQASLDQLRAYGDTECGATETTAPAATG
ncbi:MAG: hypothetical protein JWM34_645 [Ilumatobacteraceae bacterium]|nr:hypothetical protein [Ilumatobacteraceae bacterium]